MAAFLRAQGLPEVLAFRGPAGSLLPAAACAPATWNSSICATTAISPPAAPSGSPASAWATSRTPAWTRPWPPMTGPAPVSTTPWSRPGSPGAGAPARGIPPGLPGRLRHVLPYPPAHGPGLPPFRAVGRLHRPPPAPDAPGPGRGGAHPGPDHGLAGGAEGPPPGHGPDHHHQRVRVRAHGRARRAALLPDLPVPGGPLPPDLPHPHGPGPGADPGVHPDHARLPRGAGHPPLAGHPAEPARNRRHAALGRGGGPARGHAGTTRAAPATCGWTPTTPTGGGSSSARAGTLRQALEECREPLASGAIQFLFTGRCARFFGLGEEEFREAGLWPGVRLFRPIFGEAGNFYG